MDRRLITVKGLGSVTVKPDQVIITLTLSSVDPEYAAAMARAAADIEALKAAAVSAGHKEKALKTDDFGVSGEYDDRQDERGGWRRVFVGYRCSHTLTLTFPLDMEKLDRTITAFSGCGANPELGIAFTVKNPGAVSDKLLKAAVENAAKKAAVIASAAGMKLGGIASIDYGTSERVYTSRTNLNGAMLCKATGAVKRSPMADIVPEDISSTDSVTVVWELEDI